jgi:hypothetical protein
VFLFLNLIGDVMSFSFGNFDAREVEPQVGMASGPIPARKYRAQIVKANWKDNKAKTGRFLELVFEVTKGEYQGRRVWGRLNLENPSAAATQIAEGELSAICHAIGRPKPRNEGDLENLAMIIDVEVEERKDKAGEYSNRIKGYESLEDAAKNAKASGSAKRETVPAGASDDSAPWE